MALAVVRAEVSAARALGRLLSAWYVLLSSSCTSTSSALSSIFFSSRSSCEPAQGHGSSSNELQHTQPREGVPSLATGGGEGGDGEGGDGAMQPCWSTPGAAHLQQAAPSADSTAGQLRPGAVRALSPIPRAVRDVRTRGCGTRWRRGVCGAPGGSGAGWAEQSSSAPQSAGSNSAQSRCCRPAGTHRAAAPPGTAWCRSTARPAGPAGTKQRGLTRRRCDPRGVQPRAEKRRCGTRGVSNAPPEPGGGRSSSQTWPTRCTPSTDRP